MEYDSVFDFLKDEEDFLDVYNQCKKMEREMVLESYDLSFVKGRTVCEKLINKFARNDSRVSYIYSKKKDNGKPYVPGLAKLLWLCDNKKVVKHSIINKYYDIKEYGDSGAHGDNSDKYDISDCKIVHKLVFDITLHAYNEFNYPKNVNYFYGLDNFDYSIEISPEEREEQLNELHQNEVNPENLKDSFNSKKIFLTIESFKDLIYNYVDKIEDSDEFFEDLENYRYVTEETINDILYNFDDDLKKDIITEAKRLSHENSDKIIQTLNELTDDLTFKDINEMITSSSDNNQRDIYKYIKALSIDLVKNHLSRIKNEIEGVPVTYLNENGRKVSKHKKYVIMEDADGFYLDNIYLDDDQKAAVEYNENKPLIVNAGPGSGKTRILVERVVYLINELKKDPSSLLVITYTRKATQELKNRLINDTDLTIEVVSQIRISTVHGFCRHLIASTEKVPYNYLNRYGEKSLFFTKFKEDLGFKNYAFLYNAWVPDVLELYDEYFNFKLDTEGLINYVKKQMKKKEYYVKNYEEYMDGFYEEFGFDELPDFDYLEENKLIKGSYYHRFLNFAKSYPQYKKLLEKNKSCDENYVLEKAYNLLNRDYVIDNLQYKNILIDEFQDTDYNQMKIFKKLLQQCDFENGDTFTIVGDSDQSVYGWRGSNPEFFEDFVRESNSEDSKFNCITIHNNYRSSRNIVEFNEELIKKERNIQKKLIPVKSYGNSVFHISSNEYGDDEAKNIISIIRDLKKDKKIKYYSDVALLFRLNGSIEKFRETFDKEGIDYYLTENNDFLNQNEVRSMLTLFWLLMPYKEDKLVYRADEFLNYHWLKDDYFGLSKETQDILEKIQNDYEKNIIMAARDAFKKKTGMAKVLKYQLVFEQKAEILDYVFDHVKSFDIILLEESELINLGITNESDLEFFSKLRALKTIMWDDNISLYEKPETWYIFNILLNITDYFKEVSIKGDEHSIRIKDNLALFSQIINDYESIMGTRNYWGLFDYLNGVLASYSCRRRDVNEGFDKVHFITMHSAKGLEYPAVILCSLKDGLCPKRLKQRKYFRTPDYLLEYKPKDIFEAHRKEEMRLIYVATTRAKDLLILSSISRDNKPPAFLEQLKRNRNIKIKTLQTHTTYQIDKISSSKKIEAEDSIKVLNMSEILSDYLYCPYRYDIINNTKFNIKIRNRRNVESALHNLIYMIHNEEDITSEDVNEKVQAIIKFHNLSADVIANNIIENVNKYWDKYGKDYDVIKTNISLRKQLKNCDIKGKVDLIVKEDGGEISIVQFIGSDYRISEFLDQYMICLYFYVSILKGYDEFKDYKFKNIILHSIENNEKYEIPYDSNYEIDTLDYIENITTEIVEEKFMKKPSNRCDDCECNGSHC